MNPWMTKGLLISRLHKIKLCTISLKDPSVTNKNNYTSYCNIYFSLIRHAKKQYFQNKLKMHKFDAKKTWEIIRQAINNKNKLDSSIQTIISNNVVFNDPVLIANQLNLFFTSIAHEIVNNIHPTKQDHSSLINPPRIHNLSTFSFHDNPLTIKEITDAIDNLKPKNSVDLEGISTNFIKKISSAVLKPLYFIFSSSFKDGIVPSQFKISKIIPLFKSGCVTSPDNYRPISLLSSFSKVFEKVVCTRLTDFLDANNLLSESQFGFRKEHSTLHPLILFSNHITRALEKKSTL